jgi:N-acetylmuramoyl-L-alanine amidase
LKISLVCFIVADMLRQSIIPKSCIQLLLFFSVLIAHSSHAATVIAASVLPVSEYTRITIESDQALIYKTFTLNNPERIVLDIKNAPDSNKIKALSNKLLPSDATIKQIRIGKFQQNTTRVVIDLRANATAKITQYSPASGYQYRLALDVIPAQSALASDENVPENVSQSSAQAAREPDNGAKIILDREPEPDAELNSELSQ